MILAQRLDEMDFATKDGVRRPIVATIGNFDGLHLGHQALMARVVVRAEELGALATVITFDPHPRRLLDPSHAPRLMLTRAQKLALFETLDLDAVAVIPFDRALAAMPAEEFIREMLARKIGVTELYVGEGFRFGRGRAGSLDMLNSVGAEFGMSAHAFAPVLHAGAPISSSRIRQCLLDGQVEDAGAMLGRPFGLAGTIVHGEGRGGNVLVPTANLAPENEFLPARGVYITRTVRRLPDGTGEVVPGLTNIGTRPTFGDFRLVVETFLPGFSGDLYGARVELLFVKRLRDERRFDSPQDLMAQIRRDMQAFEEWRGGPR